MLSELWLLIKLLFISKPSDVKSEDLEIIVMKHFPFQGFRYMSWCGKIITRHEKKEVIDRFLNTESGYWSKIHEYGHAVQAISEHGDNWIRFYLSYYWHWLLENPILAPASSAYYTNRYEVEAYAQERNLSYWQNYTRENLRGKYTLRNGKKLYREHRDYWKDYVKTL